MVTQMFHDAIEIAQFLKDKQYEQVRVHTSLTSTSISLLVTQLKTMFKTELIHEKELEPVILQTLRQHPNQEKKEKSKTAILFIKKMKKHETFAYDLYAYIKKHRRLDEREQVLKDSIHSEKKHVYFVLDASRNVELRHENMSKHFTNPRIILFSSKLINLEELTKTCFLLEYNYEYTAFEKELEKIGILIEGDTTIEMLKRKAFMLSIDFI